ncbi:MAG: hypothetical protein ABR905_20310 [Terracidiphilus sp.]|jgi:hypothetical protein
MNWIASGPRLLMLGVIGLSACGGGTRSTSTGTGTTTQTFTVQLSQETTLLNDAQRTSLGFAFGPPDGTIGVILNAGTYSFYVPARSSTACAGTPSTEGTYRLGGSLTGFNSSYGCTALISPAMGDPNGYTFDRDYSGGGPVLPVISSAGAPGMLHIYHGEYHGGVCKNTSECFYASLGMAISTDGGDTFRKLGEIVQPYPTRNSVINAGTNLDIGGGTLILADTNGAHVANVQAADPTTVYLYIFFPDQDSTAAASGTCSANVCIGVARARLSDVLTAAFADNTAAFPGLFMKYYQGGWTQPATSGDPNAALNSGHYSPIVSTNGNFPSVLWDSATQQWVMAYTRNNNSAEIVHGTTLLSWSAPVPTGEIVDGTNALLYTTLVGEGSDPTTSNGSPWLFYITSPTWPDWTTAAVINRRATLSWQ